MSEEEKSLKDVNFNKWTVKILREYSSKNGLKIPPKSKKADIVKLVQDAVSQPDFVDKSQEEDEEEELEEEIVAGFEEEEDPALLNKEQMEKKFWQQPEYRVLLDTELAKDSDAAFYDLSNLVDNFFFLSLYIVSIILLPAFWYATIDFLEVLNNDFNSSK